MPEFLRSLPFWFEKQLVFCFIGKCHYFCLYTGTIARSDTLYLTVIQRRIGQTCTQYIVYLFIRINSPTTTLFQRTRLEIEERKLVKIVLSPLLGRLLEMNTPAIDSNRCSRFHASGGKTQLHELFGNTVRCRLRDTPPLQSGTTDMHQTVHKSTGRQHHAFRRKRHVHICHHARHATASHKNLINRVLPHI